MNQVARAVQITQIFTELEHSTDDQLLSRANTTRADTSPKSQMSAQCPATELLSLLEPGDLVLVGARPGQGKTQFSLKLLISAIKSGMDGWFFTLVWNIGDILHRLDQIGEALNHLDERLAFDNSDYISAEYIVCQLQRAPAGSMVVVDYLQLLDQKRTNADLQTQVLQLKEFAVERELILVFISQIDRSFDATNKACPSLKNVRLPNPLDLKIFDKTCFLNNGLYEFSQVHEPS